MKHNITRRRLLQVTGVGLGAGLFVSQSPGPVVAASGGWPQYAYNGGNTSYSPEASGPTSDPGVKWEYEPEASWGKTKSPAVVGGRVYCSPGNTVVSLDSEDGSEIWTYVRGDEPAHDPELGDFVRISPPAVRDGRVYVAIADGTVLALDAQTGNTDWETELDVDHMMSPTLVGESLYITASNTVYRISADNGEIQWSVELQDQLHGFPAVTDRGVWVGGPFLTQITAVDQLEEEERNPGEEEVWRGQKLFNEDEYAVLSYIDTRWSLQQPPAVVDSTVYLPSLGLQAIDTRDGTVNWEFDENVMIPSSPTVTEDELYVGSGDDVENIDLVDGAAENAGTVYALDRQDGTINWELDVGGAVNTSIAATDSTLYVSTNAGEVVAVDRINGDELWTIEVGDGIDAVADEDITGIGAPVVADGIVYIGTIDNRLVAIEEDEIESIDLSTPTPTPTPTSTPTPTPEETPAESDDSSDDTDSDDGFGPGFGLFSGLAGLGGAAYLLKRYDDGDDE